MKKQYSIHVYLLLNKFVGGLLFIKQVFGGTEKTSESNDRYVLKF